ncbi:hypothetical protein [Streptomyces liangshanensis]|uniref:hypothetical protein n=1 Tax=Streptomyces liangshanensis TaxID=2717324 RepID=UPI0036D81C05
MDAAALDIVLRATATRIEAMHPGARMAQSALRTAVQLSVWDHHGIYNSPEVGPDITVVLTAAAEIPMNCTRQEYAEQLRAALAARRVAALHRAAAADLAHARSPEQQAAAVGQLAAARHSAQQAAGSHSRRR